MSTRHDRGVSGVLAAPVRRPNGAVVIEGRIARTGPLAYGETVENRDDRGLTEIARSAVGRPLTQGHPSGLTRDGAVATVIGRIESTRIEAGHVIATIRLDTPTALDDAEELSIGYSCELDSAGFQRSITVDHVAAVAVGRCGPSCRVRVDACKCGGTCAPCRGDDYAVRFAAAKERARQQIEERAAARRADTAHARFVQKERSQWKDANDE